jgi:hypothetical protein
MRREAQPSPSISSTRRRGIGLATCCVPKLSVQLTERYDRPSSAHTGSQERRASEREEIGGHGAAVEGGAASAPHPLPPPVLASRLRSWFVFLCPFLSLPFVPSYCMHHTCARCSPPPLLTGLRAILLFQLMTYLPET